MASFKPIRLGLSICEYIGDEKLKEMPFTSQGITLEVLQCTHNKLLLEMGNTPFCNFRAESRNTRALSEPEAVYPTAVLTFATAGAILIAGKDRKEVLANDFTEICL